MSESLQIQRPAVQYLPGSETIPAADDGRDVVAGLTRSLKTIPARFFYDDRGSQLFERICDLPEYYLTRTETAILRAHAGEIAAITGPCELVELGSGSSTKTRLLLEAYRQAGLALRYVAIDVSAGILEESAVQLLADYPELDILGLVGTYEQGLHHLPPLTLPRRMVSFIGSTLGNFTPAECDALFAQVTDGLSRGEYFLLGIDLQKGKAKMEAAYNDAAGVTAEFNFNLLDNLNRTFDGNFQRDRFEHWTFYNPEAERIETYLRSRVEQTVELRALDLRVELTAGEPIRTEIARKFDLGNMKDYLGDRGLPVERVFTDDRGWFALLLCRRE